MLTSGKVNKDVVTMYPELDGLILPIQLEMFNQTYKAESLHEAKVIYRSMEHAPTCTSACTGNTHPGHLQWFS